MRPIPNRPIIKATTFVLQLFLTAQLPVALKHRPLVRAQATSPSQVRVTVVSTSPGLVRIELNSEVPTDVWSFMNVYGGVIGLGDRFENFNGVSVNGGTVQARRLAPGEFRTSERVSRISYEVKLSEPARILDKSHVSWLNNTEGLLMMADLLPVGMRSVAIKIQEPSGWQTLPSNTRSADFISSEASKLVFLLGKGLQAKHARIEANEWLLASSDGWMLSADKVKKAVDKIIKEYAKVTGFKLKEPASLYMVPLRGSGSDRWTAETRGNTVVLLMGQHGEPRELLAQLTVILTHELFHLWVPNGLALSGDYDWFFEGFTLYQALRTTQKLGLVDFDEYLRTIGRVYDSYLLAPDHDGLSLVELSARRWTSSNSLVYNRGMLTAFLYDLQLRWSSGGKRSLADIYPPLFLTPKTAGSSAANNVIIAALESPENMKQFPTDYIQTARSINLDTLLATYGIEVSRENLRTQLKVARSLSDEQRRLLKSLGYKS